MNLPVDLLNWLAAFAPIAMLLFLMIKRKWGIRAAAPVGLAVTVLTGLCFYRADPELILLQCGKGIWLSLIHISVRSHRPRITFCWLPPDSARIFVS